MRFRKKYNITNWIEWNSNMNVAIDDFFNKFSFYPNILEANLHTHSQIDFLVSNIPTERQKLIHIETSKPPNCNEEISIHSFMNEKCSIEFAVNEKIKDKFFILYYDSDPDWGNNSNDIPINIEKSNIDKKIKQYAH